MAFMDACDFSPLVIHTDNHGDLPNTVGWGRYTDVRAYPIVSKTLSQFFDFIKIKKHTHTHISNNS